MTPTLEDRMREATRLTRAGRLNEATAAILRALGAAPFEPAPQAPAARQSVVPVAERVEWRDDGTGAFVEGTHTHASLTRAYKLYVPPDAAGRALPMVVMLHGCTQDPDDFAAGTRMNRLAEHRGFYVLYPAQAAGANASRCWNWFKHNHQARHRGETALIAAMVQQIVGARGIDADRVYIAGLSAGGAMAALIAAAYPDVFAAVGVHSGLAPGVARSLPEGLAAMRSGVAPAAGGVVDLPVPTIVFHGDRDATVHPRNADRIVEAALLRVAAPHRPEVEQGATNSGQRYTRTLWKSGAGDVEAEQWLVHGAGHAWCGGHPAGSHTDARGPDASAEMLRFFLSRRRAAAGG